MKTIGIIGAMEEEIELIKPKMQDVDVKAIAGLDFYIGKIGENKVVLVRSGIGKVNAAICTQVMIDTCAVDYVINTGVAGAISPDLNIGDLVISNDVVHHDVDCTDFGYDMGVIPRLVDSFFKADPELIRIAKEACQSATDKQIYVARIASGDQFVAKSEVKERISKTFGAYCVEMESAAIAQTAYINKIPFVIIRAISDKANEEATVTFDEFVKIAAKNSSDLVESMLKSI